MSSASGSTGLDPGLDPVLAEQAAQAGDLAAQPPDLVIARDGLACPPRRMTDGTRLAQQLGDRVAYLPLPRAEASQRLSRCVVTGPEQGQQDVLGPDVVVAVGHRLAHGPRHDLHGQRGVGPGRVRRLVLAGELRDPLAHILRADPEPLQRPGRHALVRAGQGQQELLGAGKVEVEPVGLGPRQDHDVAGVVGEGHEPGDRGVDAGPGPGIEGPESQASSHGFLPGGWGGRGQPGQQPGGGVGRAQPT